LVAHQLNYLAGLGVSPGLQLGIDQFLVHSDLKTPSIGWEQGKRFDLGLKLIDQLDCQANGPVSVVSNSAIRDGNV